MPTRPARDRDGHLDRRDLPAYTTLEASHHLRLPENTIRAWSFGRTFRAANGGRRSHTPPLIAVASAEQHLLSFFNLLELHVIRGLRRDHDLRMRRIRTAVDTLGRLFPTAHPLLDRRMETDGVRLFLHDFSDLVDLTGHGQLAIPAVFQAHLRRIEYDADDLASRFFPFTRPLLVKDSAPDQPRSIIIDPRIAFGRPVVAGTRIPTAELKERWEAGDSIEHIAADYDANAQAIEEALRWESAA